MTDHDAPWREVVIGDIAILVSLVDPVAVLSRPAAADQVASWSDLDVGLRATSATVLRAPTGAWVLYRPMEAEDPGTPDGAPAAVHVSTDGALTRFTGFDRSHAIGTTRHGLWVSRSPASDPKDTAAWSAEPELTVLCVDGIRRSVTVTRQAAFACDDGEAAALIVHASAPEAVPLTSGATRHAPRFVRIDLPPEEPPPSRVEAPDSSPGLDDGHLQKLLGAISPGDVHDAPSDSGIRWNLVEISLADRQAAVAAVQREFGYPSPGMRDTRTAVVGEWPNTRVEVSFRHPHYPQGRLRRSIRVFDDAGRVAPALYASVHLMEDLATKALPPTSAANDGALEI